jgi:hypothetical protein
MAWPAMVRNDGAIYVGLQVQGGSGDLSRDVADVLLRALGSEPGTAVPQGGLPGPGPRLQDLVDPDSGFDVVLHEGFDFWVAGVEGADDAETTAALENANSALVPTSRLASVDAAYWCRIGEREHLRWVLPYDEDDVLDALARLHVRGEDSLGPGSRYIGAFRAHGLVVPVWDVEPGSGAAPLETQAPELLARLDAAMVDTTPLDAAERRARSGLAARQVTLR